MLIIHGCVKTGYHSSFDFRGHALEANEVIKRTRQRLRNRKTDTLWGSEKMMPSLCEIDNCFRDLQRYNRPNLYVNLITQKQ